MSAAGATIAGMARDRKLYERSGFQQWVLMVVLLLLVQPFANQASFLGALRDNIETIVLSFAGLFGITTLNKSRKP